MERHNKNVQTEMQESDLAEKIEEMRKKLKERDAHLIVRNIRKEDV